MNSGTGLLKDSPDEHVSLSDILIIREMAQDYNNYFQAFREKNRLSRS
jgi:hypothetical protein